jgi:rubrerythrin
MDLTVDNLLTEAMNAEIKAKEFYEQAAAKAKSNAGKNFFIEMSNFEQNHYNKVKKLIESRNTGKKIDLSWTPDLKEIRAEIEGEFEANKDEIVKVISLAIDAEKDAQERYLKIAELLDDPDEKSIFSNLADEEGNHQRILEHQFYQISNKGTIIWE